MYLSHYWLSLKLNWKPHSKCHSFDQMTSCWLMLQAKSSSRPYIYGYSRFRSTIVFWHLHTREYVIIRQSKFKPQKTLWRNYRPQSNNLVSSLSPSTFTSHAHVDTEMSTLPKTYPFPPFPHEICEKGLFKNCFSFDGFYLFVIYLFIIHFPSSQTYFFYGHERKLSICKAISPT